MASGIAPNFMQLRPTFHSAATVIAVKRVG
jgi:hypothetical protein